jgi:hypothetical protein
MYFSPCPPLQCLPVSCLFALVNHILHRSLLIIFIYFFFILWYFCHFMSLRVFITFNAVFPLSCILLLRCKIRHWDCWNKCIDK